MQYKVDTGKLKFNRYCGNQLSIRQTFVDKCTEVLLANTDNEINGKISIGTKGQLLCDFTVIAVLKTLVRMGSTPYEELAVACRQLFLSILHASDSYVTTGMMLGCLSKENYELAQLSKAIEEVVNEQ